MRTTESVLNNTGFFFVKCYQFIMDFITVLMPKHTSFFFLELNTDKVPCSRKEWPCKSWSLRPLDNRSGALISDVMPLQSKQ